MKVRGWRRWTAPADESHVKKVKFSTIQRQVQHDPASSSARSSVVTLWMGDRYVISGQSDSDQTRQNSFGIDYKKIIVTIIIIIMIILDIYDDLLFLN